MLDQETKRRIDTARDILVGKLPNPQAQVEQITIAMIYKFMDDMDKEAMEFGGEASFFTGEFEKYSWTKIFDPKLGGFEMLALYGEAIVKLNQNPSIPQLFRDIFKNAFLPYRDPETLKMFLKIINEFHYDHSEKLGDAFEYLLSVLGSQGDAGQFRTPRHIIDFMVAIIQPKKEESICDPACGTAGFLISAYKHILYENTKKNKGDLLTPDDRKKLINNFTGYDISSEMVRLSLVNLYLHGFTTPKIFEYDTLTSEDRWGDYFDIILANPPFMTPKGGIRPHKKFAMQANRSEVLFVDYIMEHINPTTGRAAIIVPEGIIFQSATAYKALRKLLVDKNFLYGVVSLPAGIFQPYSGVKTSILLLDKSLAKKTDKVLFVKIENDGFGLGAQRKELTTSDLPDAINFIKQYNTAIRNDDFSIIDFDNIPLSSLVVEKSKIAENDDYNFSADRYKTNSGKKHTKFEIVSLGDVCEINPETIIPNEIYSQTEFIYLDISSVDNGIGKYSLNNFVKGNEAASRARRKVKDGDVLLSTVRPNLKGFAFLDKIPQNVVASTGFSVLRFAEISSAKFVYHLLYSDWVQNQMLSQMGKGSYPSVNQTDVANLQIPFPPISTQQEIVIKIEQYEKIISGAKQVTENYKPQIGINTEWEMVELGSICENLDSKRKPVTASDRKEGIYPYYGASGIVDYVDEYIFDDEYLLVSEDGANLLARVTPIAFSVSGKIWVNNHAHILKFENKPTQTLLNFI
jgi:type I restriction enzyme M protein